MSLARTTHGALTHTRARSVAPHQRSSLAWERQMRSLLKSCGPSLCLVVWKSGKVKLIYGILTFKASLGLS